MKRLLLAILALCACASATTSVTGNIKTLAGGNVTSGAFVRFWLRGCGGNQPRVNGAGLIAPTQGGVFYFDFPSNGSGQISGTIYSTRDSSGLLGGDIECGGNKTSVWYGMQAFTNGKGGPEVAVHAKNAASLDISVVTPITTNPVVTAPTGDSTYCRLDAGNGLCPGAGGGGGNVSTGTVNAFTNTNSFAGATNLNGTTTVAGGIGLGGAAPFGSSINSASNFTLAIAGSSIMAASPVGIQPVGIGIGPNNRCQVDGIIHLKIQDCSDLQGGVSGLRSLIIETNTPEDLAVNPWPVNEAAELKLGTGLTGTLCDTTHLLCWVSEVPNILGAGSSIMGTGKMSAFNASPTDISSATPWATGNNWPPPLGVPTVSAPTCGISGGSLTNGNYFIYIRTANNLQTHPGDPVVAGPSMHTTEFTVNCANGGAAQSISITSPSAVGNTASGHDFSAKDYQVAAATTTGQEQIQANNGTNLSCTAGTVSTFNSVNYGCLMGSTATLKVIQTGTRFFQDTDLSNVAWVIAPNQTVSFVTMLTGLSLICGPINALPTTGGFAQGYNTPNWLIWNQSGEELVGIDPFGMGIDGPCGGYSSGTNATGGSATPFGGGWIYEDTKTPNGLLEHVQTGGTAPSCGGTCASNTPFYPFYFDGRPDGQGGAAGVPRLVNDITATPKNSGAYVPAVFYVQGMRARVHFSNIHIETNQPTSSDGIQCDNGAYCYADGVEAQTATVGTFLHLTATGAHFSGSAVCPIGTATSLQDRCAGTGGMKTFKNDITGLSYFGYMETFGGNMPTLVASGTAAMGTGAITSGTCAAAVTVAATGTATTDSITATPNTDPTGITGYAVSATGSVYIQVYPTTNNVNFKVCNNTAGTLTPGALTVNWKVLR